MKIKPVYFPNSFSNYGYILMGDINICIDSFDGAFIINELDDQKIDFIVNTHNHYDHIQGNEYLIEKCGSRLLKLEIGERLKVDDQNSIEIVEIPGHSENDIGIIHYKESKQASFFSGDTLFSAGVGNCKNGGDPAQLYNSIKKLNDILEDEVILYPGHEYRESNISFTKSILGIDCKYGGSQWSNIGEERQINPFLKVWDSNYVDDLYRRGIVTVNSPENVFIELRELRNNW